MGGRRVMWSGQGQRKVGTGKVTGFQRGEGGGVVVHPQDIVLWTKSLCHWKHAHDVLPAYGKWRCFKDNFERKH